MLECLMLFGAQFLSVITDISSQFARSLDLNVSFRGAFVYPKRAQLSSGIRALLIFLDQPVLGGINHAAFAAHFTGNYSTGWLSVF